MGLNSVSSLSYANKLFSFNNKEIKPIDIPVTSGEFLTLKQLTQKVVMSALNTTDSAKADEFIKQSGFKLEDKNISRKNENGNFFYRFEQTEKFQKSIENFQTKGQAIPLQEFTVDVSAGDLKPIVAKNSQQTKGKTNAQPKQTGGKGNNTEKSGTTTKVYQQATAKPKSDWEIVKLDPNNFAKVVKGKNGKPEVQIKTSDGDPRREIYEKSLQVHYRGRYSPETIKLYLDNRNKNDGNSVVNWNKDENGNDIPASLEEIKANLANAIIKKQPYEFGVTKSNPALEEGLSRTQTTNFGNEQEKLQLKLRDEIRAVNDKFKDIPIDNNLQKAFLELNRQNQVKDAIDKVYAESGIDFRSNQTEAQKGANETADTIEKAIRYGLDTDPRTGWMPDSLKNRIVSAGIGVFNGGAYLASAGSGIDSFFKDKAADAVSYGLNKLGINTENFDKSQTEYRQKRAEMWQAYSNLQTANLSRLDTALTEKVKRNLPLGGMDIPSLERSVGSVLPQAVVQGTIATATLGASIPAQIAITAGVNGGIAFGATYSQTNDGWKAGEEAIWTAGQTAMIPISSKLPGVANTAFDLATGYVVGKMRGQSDIDILDSMLTQGILGAGFKAGSKFAELSPAMKQKAVDTFKTVAKESQKAVDGIYNKAKAKFNLAEAETNYKQAKIELTKQKVGVVSTVISAGGVGGGAVSPVKFSKALLDVGKYHILKGASNFKEFSASVLADVGDKAKGKLLNMYEKLVGKEKANADKTYQAAKNAVNYQNLESNWIGKEVKVGDKLPDGYHWNGEQIRRNGGNVDAGYGKLQVDANGRISFASEERLSNPNTMNKNFKTEYFDEVKDRVSKTFPTLKGEDLIKRTNEVINRWEKHHIIPDGIAQTDPLMQIARQLGWNVDEGKNQIGLNKKDTMYNSKLDNSKLGHWSDHKAYTGKVRIALDKALKRLEKNVFKKPLSEMRPEEFQIHKSEILKEIKKVQDDFKNQIKDGTAPSLETPSGQKRIAFNPYQQRDWSMRV